MVGEADGHAVTSSSEASRREPHRGRCSRMPAAATASSHRTHCRNLNQDDKAFETPDHQKREIVARLPVAAEMVAGLAECSTKL